MGRTGTDRVNVHARVFVRGADGWIMHKSA